MKFPLAKSKNVAGETARTGKPIIVKRSNVDKIEQLSEITVKSTFSFPIYHEKKMLFVVQLYNKHGTDYGMDDLCYASSFSKYCGALIERCIQYDWVLKKYRHDQMARRMITHYINFDDAAPLHLLHCSHSHRDFDSFFFEPWDMCLVDSATWSMKIFENLGLLRAFNIDRKDFAMFILHVKMAYHNYPYHNWMLAFCTLHFTYLVISNLMLIERHVLR